MQLKKIVLISLGFLFLILGAIGMLVPVWPTTPFVLLSVACFSNSPKIKAKIMEITFFKEYVESYQQGKGISQKTFYFSMIWLWTMLIISMILVQSLWLTILLLFIGSAVTIHILWIYRAK